MSVVQPNQPIENTQFCQQITCVHNIIEDLIDITPDNSKYVYYCDKCHECFVDIHGNKTHPLKSPKQP